MNERVKEIVHILCCKELEDYETNDILVGATLFVTGMLINIDGFKTPYATTYAKLHDAIEEIIEDGIVNENDERQ